MSEWNNAIEAAAMVCAKRRREMQGLGKVNTAHTVAEHLEQVMEEVLGLRKKDVSESIAPHPFTRPRSSAYATTTPCDICGVTYGNHPEDPQRFEQVGPPSRGDIALFIEQAASRLCVRAGVSSEAWHAARPRPGLPRASPCRGACSG